MTRLLIRLFVFFAVLLSGASVSFAKCSFSKNMQNCSDTTVCDWALAGCRSVDPYTNSFNFNIAVNLTREEARRRGLTCWPETAKQSCRVTKISAYEFLGNYFKARSTKQRFLVQAKLKALGYMSGSIDGIFGPITYNAILGFRNKYDQYNKLKRYGGIQRLLSKIESYPVTIQKLPQINVQTQKTPEAKKTCRADPKRCSQKVLCSMATAYSAGLKIWSIKSVNRKYVSEAARRGLNCGITETSVTRPRSKPSIKPLVLDKTRKHDFLEKLHINNYGSFLHSELAPKTLFFFGKIEKNDSFELRKALRLHQVNLIVLASSGGSIFEGLQMAGIIHDKKLTTYVPNKGRCASACSFMFFAGDKRKVRGRLGVHQFYSKKGSENAQREKVEKGVQFTVSKIIGFLNEFGTPAWVYEGMFQQADMYYFKRGELEKLETEIDAKLKISLDTAEAFISELRAAIAH